MIEALGDEGVTLDKERTEAGKWCERAAKYGARAWAQLEDGRVLQDDGEWFYPLELRQAAGDVLRDFRKSLTKQLRGAEWA
jgi:hypothetical protein